MRVINEFLKTYAQDPTRYLDFARFSGQTANDFILLPGCSDFRRVQSVARGGRVVFLELEEPNRFFLYPGVPDFHHTQYDPYWSHVFTLCPFTADWINQRDGGGRWTPVFFPFNEDYIPEECPKRYDVIYTGEIHSPRLERLVSDLGRFNYRLVSRLPHPRATDYDCSYQQKLRLVAQSKISIVHNLLFPTPDHVGNVRAIEGYEENRAFSEISALPSTLGAGFDCSVPQLKSRLFEAAFSRSLILCQRDSWNVVERFFEPDKEFVYFEPDSLAATVESVLGDFRRYVDVVERAHARACRDYTTRAFFNRFLRDLHFTEPVPRFPERGLGMRSLFGAWRKWMG